MVEQSLNFSNYDNFYNETIKAQAKCVVLFTGTSNAEGYNWCGDCRNSKDAIKTHVENQCTSQNVFLLPQILDTILCRRSRNQRWMEGSRESFEKKLNTNKIKKWQIIFLIIIFLQGSFFFWAINKLYQSN